MNPKMNENKEIKSNEKLISYQREAIDWKEFSEKYGKRRQKVVPFCEQTTGFAESQLKKFSIISCLVSKFPIIEWLPKYDIKNYLCPDLIAGLTISVLHVPQGIGNAFVLDLDPIYGLYVSFFPVLIYLLMGTSRHVSIGSFVLTSLMIANTADKLGAVRSHPINATTSNTTDDWPPTKMEVYTTVGIVTGLMQIVMGLLSLGSLSLILSDELVSSFTSGAAFHVVVSQLDTILGLSTPNQNGGPFKLLRTLDAIRRDMDKINGWTVMFSLIVISVLLLYKEWAEPNLKKMAAIPIPIDMLVVIISTIISWLTKFNKKLDIDVVGQLSTGLPTPQIPRFDFVYQVLSDSFIIATVTFAISLSLAKIFAKRNKYEIDSNQELIALGASNVFSSFFQTFPASAALSRSTLLDRIGGKTQMASLFSCFVLLSVLLVLAPFLYHLPQFVLSCIIIIAIKSMFKQLKDFWEFWFISKLDASVWMVTFMSIIFLDVDIGLIIGILYSLHVILIRIVMPTSAVLGRLPSTEMYVDIDKYSNAEEIEDIKIFRFCSPIFYLSKDTFKRKILKLASIPGKDSRISVNHTKRPKAVLIDMSCIPFMDKSGVDTIVDVIKELDQHNINVCLVSSPIHVIEMFERTKFFKNFHKCCVYPTITDAIITLRH